MLRAVDPFEVLSDAAAERLDREQEVVEQIAMASISCSDVKVYSWPLANSPSLLSTLRLEAWRNDNLHSQFAIDDESPRHIANFR